MDMHFWQIYLARSENLNGSLSVSSQWGRIHQLQRGGHQTFQRKLLLKAIKREVGLLITDGGKLINTIVILEVH